MQVLFAFLSFVHLFKYTSSNKLRYHKLSGTKRALCEIPRILDINEVSSLNKMHWDLDILCLFSWYLIYINFYDTYYKCFAVL